VKKQYNSTLTRYGTFMLTLVAIFTQPRAANVIQFDSPKNTVTFGNSQKGRMTIFPYHDDNQITFCTEKGSDPKKNQYKRDECMNVISDGRIPSLFFALSEQANRQNWYINSPCFHVRDKTKPTELSYSTLVDCYHWLAENEMKSDDDVQLSTFVDKSMTV
jgi:hypothetical protein